MRIGIITWFTGPNYGTNLQAIALQYYLRNQGFEVEIINYEVTSTLASNKKKFIIKKLFRHPRKYLEKLAMIKYKKDICERDEKLKTSIQNHCVLTNKIKNTEELIQVCNTFDLLICGSDQIWNPNWYDPFYYADYDGIVTRRISYAPSMGVNAIPNCIALKIKKSINKFDHISVREKHASDMLTDFTNIKPEVVVDPTLLLDENDWNEIFPLSNQHHLKKKEYILAFFLGDEINHFNATKQFAKSHNLKLILIPYKGKSYIQKAKIHANAGLQDLFDLLRGAKYIITDSFHITVFSIIYKKQFYVFQRFKEDSFTSQNIRITNLLHLVDLEERLIPYQSKYISDFMEINYTDHIFKLNEEIIKSKTYLKKSI